MINVLLSLRFLKPSHEQKLVVYSLNIINLKK